MDREEEVDILVEAIRALPEERKREAQQLLLDEFDHQARLYEALTRK